MTIIRELKESIRNIFENQRERVVYVDIRNRA